MNIAVFAVELDNEPRAFAPEHAPDLVIDWERFGKFVQAFRTKTRVSRTRLAQACGVHRAQIEKAEQGFPLSANNLLRLCVFLQREPSFFYKTLRGWQPHLPQ